MKRDLLARILRKIAHAIEASDVAEWEDFEIEFRPSKTRAKKTRHHKNPPRQQPDLNLVDVANLLEQFEKASSREAAAEALEKLRFTRNQLVALARPRSVHVTKDDNVQRIKEKLVESIVGSRLNSLAIRGK